MRRTPALCFPAARNARKCAGIVRNQHAPLSGRQRQDFLVLHPAQSGGVSG